MREIGRARVLLASLPCVFALIATTTCEDYGIPIEIKLWDTGRTPLAHMVDVTNGFGLKVLAEHNFLNDNNIAFSPYGLMGILVALFEGVDGEASYQIQRGMQLPWNRNVMRVGFRDIHRTLKTYFVPEEGFLAGLALNNENVTFNDSYKKILRFYGFDLENDQLPTFSPQAPNSSNTTTTMAAMTMRPGDITDTSTVAMTSRDEPTTAPTREETTPNPNAETLSEIDVRDPIQTTTASPSLAPNAESTTSGPIATMETVPTTLPSTSTAFTTNTLPNNSSESDSETTTIMPSTAEEMSPSQTTMALSDETTETNEIATPIMASTGSIAEVTETRSTTLETTAGTTAQTDGSTPSTMSERLETETASTTPVETTPESLTTTSTLNESSLETLERRKKSIVDFIFTNPPYIDDYLFYRSYDIGAELPKPTFDDKMFLVNGLRNVEVPYMHYDTVLEHAYLPHLEASALRLPLDSDRYYLLVVLPLRGGAPELGRLLARMARESDLSDVYAALRPRRVRAIVPGFTVKGHVTLTTDLQKLGLRDVFEPRQRDFTPMTRQSGVYVRSIEQAVSVAIRKYRPDQKKNRYVKNREPVSFSATYPFLYFVMDASIHVSLMAGKMVDPLNSRIL